MKKLLIFLILFIIFDFILVKEAKAGAGDNVSGWAWSENIGWISFNNTTGGGTTDYGVNIDDSGAFSGYAWSENIGWIDFAPAGPYPSPPNRSVKVDLNDGEVSGWARALAYGDGWDGWIKLRGPGYGVEINRTTGQFSGWAWSDLVIGWISFSCQNQGVCGTSDYKVVTSFVFPPSVSNPHETWENVCVDSLHPTLRWDYSDGVPDGYQVQIATDPGFSNIILNKISEQDSTSYTPLSSDFITDLQYGGITYYWQVKAKNKGGKWSEWSDIDTFITYLHSWPRPDFNWTPQSPSVDEVVKFCSVYEDVTIPCEEPPCPVEVICENKTTFYNSGLSWSWNFGDGITSSEPNPTHSYSNPVTYTVVLEVTDSAGYSCATDPLDPQYRITVQLPLPEWKEIPPFIWLKNLLVSILEFLRFHLTV